MLLNYKEYGSGEPIIVLHGLLGMLDNWHSFSKLLAENYWVISVDQRNHGKSFHSDDFNYQLLSNDLFQFLEEMHIPKCHLLGHSMGGKTAMQFLHDHSEIVDKAIIVDIAPKSYVGNHEIILEALLSVDFSKMESRKQVQEILEEKIKEPGVVQFLLKNLHRNGGLGYKWKANVEALNNNYENILAGIEAEHVIDNDVLFVKAGKSDYIQEIDFSLINELFPNNQIKEIKNAGHWVHADSKEVLLDMVQDFLLNEK